LLRRRNRSASALAIELGVTENWIWLRMQQADPIPHIRLPGAQRTMFHLPTVMAWITKHTVQPAPTVRDKKGG
jgi:hypothetical protein